MKPTLEPIIEAGRVKTGPFGSDPSYGPNGHFFIESPAGVTLQVIASNGGGWEHVSVSVARVKRCPTWDEMVYVKMRFWEREETVIEYHPAAKDYVNNHPFVLHLWRPIGVNIPKPPRIMV